MRTKKSKTIKLLALLFYSYSTVCIGNPPESLIIAIAKKKKKEFSEASVESSQSVRYALEVPQGWFKKNNIGPGCSIKLL